MLFRNSALSAIGGVGYRSGITGMETRCGNTGAHGYGVPEQGSFCLRGQGGRAGRRASRASAPARPPRPCRTETSHATFP
ncbi:hypothetical protein MTBLM1_90067 [Rhodospirillaceae bacterium LM-1]|nr:hypothetical protein MTBLM1_90067 [Rhodospirillaceae bacterium LM-1]